MSGLLGTILKPIVGDAGTTSQNQVPLETPEQKAAREMLARFMNTGQFGNFTAGADIGIRGPNTSLTPIEAQGQSSLATLLNSSLPEGYATGDAALKNMLGSTNEQIKSQFDPFKTQVERMIGQSTKDLVRKAGFAKNLYSTSTIQGLGDIQARGNETLTSQLASLTNDALNRQLQAIPLAYQSASGQEGIMQNRISSAYNFGGLPRELENRGTDASNAEILRRRNELLLPYQTAVQLSGQNANFGVPSVTTQNENPMLDLLSSIISGGSKIIAAKKGGS